jgi:hypothetical protein
MTISTRTLGHVAAGARYPDMRPIQPLTPKANA